MTSKNWRNKYKTTIYPSSQMKTKLESIGYKVTHIKDNFYEIRMFTSGTEVVMDFITREFRVIKDHVASELKYTKDIIKTIEFIYGQKI